MSFANENARGIPCHMAFKLRTPGGDRTWLSLAFLGLGLYVLIGTGFRPRLVIGIPALVLTGCGVGLWFCQQWARWIAMGAQIFLGGYWSYKLFTTGFQWMDAGCVIGAGYFTWALWYHFAPARIAAHNDSDESEGEEKEQKPMISLVLLLRQPRYLEAAILAQTVSSAWGGDYSSAEDDDENSERFVVGESPLFAVQSPEAFFVVHNFDRPYFDDTAAAAEDMNEMRLQRAIEEHSAWMAVDLIRLHDEQGVPESVYPQIARLIAELAGEDCLAILQPETGQINVWDDSLEEKLRGPNPLEEFAIPTKLPVIRVNDDDPRMIAAVAEAKRRWPEFVSAYQERTGQNFSVKAPVTVGERTEFIWVAVDGLEPEYVHGTLDNDPVDLGDLKHGSRVEIPVGDVNDWAFVRDDDPVGMFTVKVLAEVRGETRRAAEDHS